MLVTLDLVVTKVASQEGEIRDALGTTDQSLKIGTRITPPAQGKRRGLPKPPVLLQHEKQPAEIERYSHLHS